MLHNPSGVINPESGSVEEYARGHGFDMMPAIKGDQCVKLRRNDDRVATAPLIAL